jgi:putative transposase
VGQIQEQFPGVSLRRVCSWLKLRRSSVYERRRYKAEEIRQLKQSNAIEQMKKIRREYRCWGFRLMYAYMCCQKVRISWRRAYRLYRLAGLSLHRTPKKPRIKRVYQDLLPPKHINEGWAMDFLSEWVIGPHQQSVRIINVIDECSRKDLWVEAAWSITATKLSDVLDKIIDQRGKPAYIRCDNGPEFISEHLKTWAEGKGIKLRFIQPGKPTQNGIIERLNGTLRTECLNLHWFNSLDEINELLGMWFKTYNFDRPHSSLNYLTPHAFESQNQNLYFRMVAA